MAVSDKSEESNTYKTVVVVLFSYSMKHMAAGIVLLVAPVSLCGAISAYSGDAFSVKSLAKTIFEVYQYDQMYGIWTYTFSTLIYFPLWLQLTIVALTNCSSSRDAPSFPIER